MNQCGLRICPYSGFAHDYQWFVNEYGLDKGGKLWTESPEDIYADGNDCVHKAQTGRAQSSADKNQNDGDQTDVDFGVVACRIPAFEEIRIDTSMKQLNLARLVVTSPCKNVDIIKAYNVRVDTNTWLAHCNSSQTISVAKISTTFTYFFSRNRQPGRFKR